MDRNLATYFLVYHGAYRFTYFDFTFFLNHVANLDLTFAHFFGHNRNTYGDFLFFLNHVAYLDLTFAHFFGHDRNTYGDFLFFFDHVAYLDLACTHFFGHDRNTYSDFFLLGHHFTNCALDLAFFFGHDRNTYRDLFFFFHHGMTGNLACHFLLSHDRLATSHRTTFLHVRDALFHLRLATTSVADRRLTTALIETKEVEKMVSRVNFHQFDVKRFSFCGEIDHSHHISQEINNKEEEIINVPTWFRKICRSTDSLRGVGVVAKSGF